MPDTLKVCLVTAEYPPKVGGVADYTRLLAPALAGEGLEVTVLTSPGSEDPHPPGHPEPAKQEQAASSFAVKRSLSHWDFRLFHEMDRALEEVQPSVVHIQYETAAYGMHPAINLLPWWLRRRSKTICVTTLHDLREPYLFPKAGPLRRWVNRQLIAHSHGVITTNAEDTVVVRTLLTERSGATPRLTVIPIGTNIGSCSHPGPAPVKLRQQWGIADGTHVVGHFGLLNHAKGVETLFRALRHLLDQGLAVVLVMLGEEAGTSDPTNRRYRDHLRKLARALGLEPYLRWT